MIFFPRLFLCISWGTETLLLPDLNRTLIYISLDFRLRDFCQRQVNPLCPSRIRFLAAALSYLVGYRNHLEMMRAADSDQVRRPSHAAILIEDFADDARTVESRQ